MTHGNDFINYVSSSAVEGDNLGLTKREYFAAMAFQGLCVVMEFSTADVIAEEAVKQSDALINALNKQP